LIILIFYVNIDLQYNKSTLIKSGGGNGPGETQQPPFGKVLISAAVVLKDKKRCLKIFMSSSLIEKGFFIFENKK
jgi:hypothetical protein